MTQGDQQSGSRSVNAESETPAPVFIAGLAHSGKTELRRALSQLPHLELTRKTYLWTRFSRRFGDLEEVANLERCLDALLRDPRVVSLNPDAERIRSEFTLGPRTYVRLFALVHQHHAERLGKPRWGDQLGSVEHVAGPILRELPEAKMIHMVRDPRVLLVAEASSRRSPERLGWNTARWVASADVARTNEERFPEQYLVLRYEDLWFRPEEAMQRVCRFLEEPYSPEMAAGFSDGHRDHKDETAPVTGRSALGMALVERYATTQVVALGYPESMVRLPGRDRPMFHLVVQPRGLAGMTAWRIARGGRRRWEA
jgi:hypothetical protein